MLTMIRKKFYKKRRNNLINGSFLILIFLSVSLIIQNSPNLQTVEGYSGSFSEDFTTTTYLDGSSTTAEGWGDGFLLSAHKTPEIMGSYPTTSYSLGLDIFGDYAFIADWDNGLKILNISQPNSPTYVSSYDTGYAYDVCVDGNYAYVTDAINSFQVVNITDPSSPDLVGSFNMGVAVDLCISGDFAYLAAGLNGLKGVFLLDPLNPWESDSYSTTGSAVGVCIEANYAFVATNTSGMTIINITRPFSIGYLSSYSSSQVCKVSVSGNFAYIAAGEDGFHVLDITNIRNPYSIFNSDLPVYANDIHIDGDFAYITDKYSENGLLVYDITKPSSPKFLGNCLLPDNALDIHIEGSYAYIACYSAGLQVIEINKVITPSLADSISVSGFNAYNVHVSGDYAYVPGGLEIQIVNISNQNDISIVGSLDFFAVTQIECYDFHVFGDYGYLAFYDDDMFEAGIYAYNLTDPTNPVFLNEFREPGEGYSLDIAGNYLYYAVGSQGMIIVNLEGSQGPSYPIYVDRVSTNGEAYDVCVSGNYAYIADGSSGLFIEDITDIWALSSVASYDIQGNARGIYVSGDYAYVADSSYGLKVINITDPYNPEIVGSCSTVDSAQDVYVSGDYAYIATSTAGITVVNITNPTNPEIIDISGTSGNSKRVIVSGNYAYVASYNEGLEILEVRKNMCDQFESNSIAQSIEIYHEEYISLTSATLTASSSTPDDTSISYFMSADNGIHWEQVTLGVEHYFSNTGNQLKWRAVLSTTDSLETPSISSSAISYTSILNNPSLISPDNAYTTDDNTPIFEWSSVGGTSEYLIQIDTTTGFSSPFINETVPSSSTSYTPISGLGDGIWYWRVAAIDVDGDLGMFSAYRSIVIDAKIPTIDHPDNFDVDYGSINNSITWHPNDNNPLSYNVTKNGALIDEGPWNNEDLTVLFDGEIFGEYLSFVCTVYDVNGYSASDEVVVNVFDFSPPVFYPPDDVTYYFGTTGHNITWIADEPHPVSYSVVRDWVEVVSFGLWDGNPIVVNIDGLSLGNHTYDCYLYDDGSNEAKDTVLVDVTPLNPPSIDHPDDLIVDYGSEGLISWYPIDNNPFYYNITRDGVIVAQGPWNNESINIICDGDVVGATYTYICTVYDEDGYSASDTVFVYVSDLTAPIVNEPLDFYYNEGTTGNNITWIATDPHPGTYFLYLNGILIDADVAWISGTSIIINVDGSTAGIYNYTIEIFDAHGNSFTDTVIVSVVADVPEFNIQQSMILSLLIISLFICSLFIIKRKKIRHNS